MERCAGSLVLALLSVLSDWHPDKADDATAKLPDPDRHWSALVTAGKNATGFGEAGEVLEALANLALAKPEPRKHDLA